MSTLYITTNETTFDRLSKCLVANIEIDYFTDSLFVTSVKSGRTVEFSNPQVQPDGSMILSCKSRDLQDTCVSFVTKKKTVDELQQIYTALLKSHDDLFEFSDDRRAYNLGRYQQSVLKKIAKLINEHCEVAA